MATAVDLNSPDFAPERENPRDRAQRLVTRKPPASKSAKLVKVACITELRPWIETMVEREDDDGVVRQILERRPLAKKEIAMVPEWQADIMISNDHVMLI